MDELAQRAIDRGYRLRLRRRVRLVIPIALSIALAASLGIPIALRVGNGVGWITPTNRDHSHREAPGHAPVIHQRKSPSKIGTSGRGLVGGPGAAQSESSAFGGSIARNAARNGRIVFGSVVGANTGYSQIYTMNADGTDRRRLTNSSMSDMMPAWSADATRIAFASNRDGPDYGIYVMSADGSHVRHVITISGMWSNHPAWSPDGTKIAFVAFTDPQNTAQGQRIDVWIVNADGSNAQRFVDGQFPAWSPDGKYIAFDVLGDNGPELFVSSLDRNDERDLGQGGSPAWSPDGKRIAAIGGKTMSKPQSLVVMNAADGSGRRTLASSQDFFGKPSFSPDGRTIAFDRDPDGHTGVGCGDFVSPQSCASAYGPLPSAIWTIGSDGSHLRQLSGSGDNDQDAAFGARR